MRQSKRTPRQMNGGDFGSDWVIPIEEENEDETV